MNGRTIDSQRSKISVDEGVPHLFNEDQIVANLRTCKYLLDETALHLFNENQRLQMFVLRFGGKVDLPNERPHNRQPAVEMSLDERVLHLFNEDQRLAD
jgi:hypothetical protein